MAEQVIQVRAKTMRYSYDGETGVLVLKGTTGEVAAMTLHKTEGISGRTGMRMGPKPLLTVYWDAVVVQGKANDEPSTLDAWEESEIDPNEIEFVSAAARVNIVSAAVRVNIPPV